MHFSDAAVTVSQSFFDLLDFFSELAPLITNVLESRHLSDEILEEVRRRLMKLLKQPKENVKSVCSKHDFQRCFA
jgi:hypothetical protein